MKKEREKLEVRLGSVWEHYIHAASLGDSRAIAYFIGDSPDCEWNLIPQACYQILKSTKDPQVKQQILDWFKPDEKRDEFFSNIKKQKAIILAKCYWDGVGFELSVEQAIVTLQSVASNINELDLAYLLDLADNIDYLVLNAHSQDTSQMLQLVLAYYKGFIELALVEECIMGTTKTIISQQQTEIHEQAKEKKEKYLQDIRARYVSESDINKKAMIASYLSDCTDDYREKHLLLKQASVYDANALIKLLDFYRCYKGFRPDPNKYALFLYQCLCDLVDPSAKNLNNIGDCYNEGCISDIRICIDEIKIELSNLSKCNFTARFYLAKCYQKEIGFEKNLEYAKDLFLEIAYSTRVKFDLRRRAYQAKLDKEERKKHEKNMEFMNSLFSFLDNNIISSLSLVSPAYKDFIEILDEIISDDSLVYADKLYPKLYRKLKLTLNSDEKESDVKVNPFLAEFLDLMPSLDQAALKELFAGWRSMIKEESEKKIKRIEGVIAANQLDLLNKIDGYHTFNNINKLICLMRAAQDILEKQSRFSFSNFFADNVLKELCEAIVNHESQPELLIQMKGAKLEAKSQQIERLALEEKDEGILTKLNLICGDERYWAGTWIGDKKKKIFEIVHQKSKSSANKYQELLAFFSGQEKGIMKLFFFSKPIDEKSQELIVALREGNEAAIEVIYQKIVNQLALFNSKADVLSLN